MKSKITILFITFLSTISLAQTKVGTINSDYIMSLMPESQIVYNRAKAYGAKLDSLFDIKAQNFKTKVDAFRKSEKEMDEALKKTKVSEISALELDIKKYKDNGNKLMQLKQDELMRPLYKKLGDAINQVAKEQGYTQVLTSTGNQFVYIDEKFDITKLVMNKLGVKEPEVKK
ncbi:OmpH family outer membrane protein [Polaribacter ponticola]|uniref:OmpH family outer membrane protein n=1 Tax=Polaribacter ponticola TaxID=2978475 RepID=A0ABT5SEQ4_9FLAO|nr:OmpH family outer membrane protein [Polaribacter sp. MSW5]MDD7915916.1 OmpH family outer membrane protein [Polaribacter sp. MSW5]